MMFNWVNISFNFSCMSSERPICVLKWSIPIHLAWYTFIEIRISVLDREDLLCAGTWGASGSYFLQGTGNRGRSRWSPDSDGEHGTETEHLKIKRLLHVDGLNQAYQYWHLSHYNHTRETYPEEILSLFWDKYLPIIWKVILL